ncbi:glycosyltransferase family 4 protein [Pseudoalteromonas sp. TB64]|uniref:glycosyltransferase family 4 protein n=1 Tax=Pseudoalteromonas sp. TB64 TaxID=1938600 RepID=UPI0003FFD5C7|nr:glycosyltransferase family 4 protein [Pseudoalteromonas sp. TB64]
MIIESIKPCVLLTSNQYKPNIGGIENSIYHLGQEYKKLGYDVVIVVSDLNSVNASLPEYELEEGIIIYRYKAEKTSGFGRGVKHVTNAIKLYKKVFKRHNPCLTVCRFHFNLVILKMAGYKNIVYLVPGVVENETKASFRQQNRLLDLVKSKVSLLLHKVMQYFAFKYCDRLFVFSENMRRQIARVNKTKPILICKPGVSLTRFTLASPSEKRKLREAIGLPFQGRVFLCIGRFVKAKGFDIAIKALKELDDKNVQLWFLGEGAEEIELRELCISLDLNTQVQFLGRQSSPEIYYRASDFFIMSSTYEPLGQTILEALCCGLPIVGAKSSSSVVTATSEILDSTNNMLINEHSSISFSLGMKECLNLNGDSYLTLQAENRKLAELNYSWQKLAEDLISND